MPQEAAVLSASTQKDTRAAPAVALHSCLTTLGDSCSSALEPKDCCPSPCQGLMLTSSRLSEMAIASSPAAACRSESGGRH